MKLLCEFTERFSIRYEVGWLYVVFGLRSLTIGISSYNYRRHGIYKWTFGSWSKCCSDGYHGFRYEGYMGRYQLVADIDKYDTYEDLNYYFMNN